MGSRFPSHQLSNGLYVSGRPEQPKERPPTMSSTAMPYTGGDIKRSGELGKMFDIPVDGSRSRKSGPINNAPSRTGSFGGAASHSGPIMSNSINRPGSVSSAGIPGSASVKKTNSGPLNRHGDPVKKSSGPQPGGGNSVSRQNSGPLAPVLPTTGLITSGPISSGPLNSSGAPRKVSGPLDSTGSLKLHAASIAHNQAVTNLSQEDEYSFHRSFPKPILWSMVFAVFAAVFIWNTYWGRRAITGFIARYPDAELRTARDGQFVKVSGVVTCGNVPLESSFQRVPRCVYTSTSLYEYRGWDSKAANPTHRRFTWGLRSLEVERSLSSFILKLQFLTVKLDVINTRHVVDFYISDFQSGLRALVKTGLWC
ncbi:putative membrane protein [Vitis vinifera]|uniref:Putative membrane protein n=1 Tax=Vitis vinifera TaxID=29760 RepID=A0A438JFC1_VITVI|nr:putative membrane protein [Vitis vinifera]